MEIMCMISHRYEKRHSTDGDYDDDVRPFIIIIIIFIRTIQYNTEQNKNHKITVQCIVVVIMCKFQQCSQVYTSRYPFL